MTPIARYVLLAGDWHFGNPQEPLQNTIDKWQSIVDQTKKKTKTQPLEIWFLGDIVDGELVYGVKHLEQIQETIARQIQAAVSAIKKTQ